ncbi:MAG TPA: hypothetical protein VGW38_07605, partial [Chloroflexota bacterium]|nr:hypothetical protein [Chloroflexota bacterium]
MTYTADGASLEVRFVEPSVDLATLATCLAEAVPGHAVQTDRQEQPAALLLNWDPVERVLSIDTRVVLARMTRTRGFRTLSTGFCRDTTVPRSKARAHLGGHIVDGTDGVLRQALDCLTANVESALDSLIAAGLDPTVLVQSDPERTLRVMGSKAGVSPDDFLRTRTQVRRTTFGHVAKTQRERQEEIARLMAAVEEMDGGRADHFERLAMAVRELLRADGCHEHEIEAALAFYREQAQTPGTQLSRFFDFLEDEALARIRLQVTFRMMEAIASEAFARVEGADGADMALLVSYVRRTVALYQSL